MAGKVDVQELLVGAGLVYVNRLDPVGKYVSVENQARKTQELIWQPKLRCF